MMDKYDEILQVFASQKEEITLMSNKINELEKTNLFLMQFIEKNNHLPPVCDVASIQRYKDEAIDREYTINTAREKAHVDATFCETSLEMSYDEHDRSECNTSLHFSVLPDKEVQCSMLSPVARLTVTSRSDDITISPNPKVELGPLSKSGSLRLRISHHSPTRRQSGSHRNILNENSGDPSQSSDERKNTIIERRVSELVETSNEMSSSNLSDNFHAFPKTFATVESSTASEQPSSNIEKDDQLKLALDYLITTLEERTDRTCDKNVTSFGQESLEELLHNKEAILDDKHTQMKLLLTSQQLKADLFHRTLDENNKKIIDAGHHLVQQNTSNRMRNVQVVSSDDGNNEVNVEVTPRFSEIKIRRQNVLDRLNSTVKEQAPMDPKVRLGFVKFTALVKGYIVRTLLETDKVRTVILTIKDTAKMALTIRQERMSGDCLHPGDGTSYSHRRSNQETLSFQNRLVSQLRHGLNELHEIFFIWPAYSRMYLLRNHINQLLCQTSKYQITDHPDEQGTSTSTMVRTKRSAPLSSATIKRRQKMALRRSEGNFKSALSVIKENGNKTHISSPTQRKPIYTSPYGCRGYPVGPHARAPIGQSKGSGDRKSRTNNLAHRRGPARKVPEPDINPVFENSKSNTSTATVDHSESSECNVNKAPSNIKDRYGKSEFQQQQQQWIQPKTVTTSVCSKASGDVRSYKSGFVTTLLEKNNCAQESENNNDILHDTSSTFKTSAQSNFFQNPSANIQANTNNVDWKNSTYKMANNGTSKENTYHGNSTLFYPNHRNAFNAMDNSFSKVEVDIEDNDFNYLYKNNSNLFTERYNGHSHYPEDPTEDNDVVVVDVSQPFTESDPNTNELRSTYNSNTSQCANKPTVTANNTKYSNSKSKPLNPPMSSLSKNAPLQAKVTGEFDFSSSNIVSSRTFKIRKRIVARNSTASRS